MLRDKGSERLVVDVDDLFAQVALPRVPHGIDAERLHVDALRIHLPQPVTGNLLQPRIGDRRLGDLGEPGLARELQGGRYLAMSVHVDRECALAIDDDVALARPGRLRMRSTSETAADETQS